MLVSFNHSNPLVGSQLAVLLSANQSGQPGRPGSRGRPVREALSTPDALGVVLTTILPATPVLPPLAADGSPAPGKRDAIAPAVLEARATRSVDQVLTRLGEDRGAGARHQPALAADGIDALLPDLFGQAGEPL